MFLDDIPEQSMFLLRQVLLLLPELCVGITGHPHGELGRIEVVHELVAFHVILLYDEGQLLDVILIVRLLARAIGLDKVSSLVLVLENIFDGRCNLSFHGGVSLNTL